MKATCFHTRNAAGIKLTGGGWTRTDMTLNDAAARLTAEFEVGVTNSGRVTFMRNGAPIWLYLSVDPAETDKGRAALIADSNARAAAERERRAKEEAQQAELDALLSELGPEAAIAHLRALSILKKAQP